MAFPISIRLERRLEEEGWLKIAIPLASLAIALLLSSTVFAAHGLNPIRVYGVVFPRVFGTPTGLTFLVLKAIPLLLCAVGLTLAFRARVWNIGAEGQLLLGAVAAAGLALFVMPGAPSYVLIPIMFVAGFLAGAAWALLPAVLKARLNVDEVITTLMMNYIAYKLVEYLIYGPWRGQATWGFPFTDIIPENAQLPTVPGTTIHWPTLLLALLAAVGMSVLLERTSLGYEVRVFGGNPDLARAAGIRPGKLILICMLISGGLAGLAGVGELAGVHKRLKYPWAVAAGYGYTAIIVAWLARLNPLACVLTAFFMGALLAAGSMMRATFNISYASVNVFNGLILLCLVASEVLIRYRVRLVIQAGRKRG